MSFFVFGCFQYMFLFQIDDVRLPSWQAQIKGKKRWTVKTPRECLYLCQELFEVEVQFGDISKWKILDQLTIIFISENDP